MMPTPPVLSSVQREAGLAVRRERAEIRKWIREGLDEADLRLLIAWQYPAVQTMKVRSLLTAIPYIGRTKALSLLARAGIPESKKVQGCGPKQTERLFELLTERSPGI